VTDAERPVRTANGYLPPVVRTHVVLNEKQRALNERVSQHRAALVRLLEQSPPVPRPVLVNVLSEYVVLAMLAEDVFEYASPSGWVKASLSGGGLMVAVDLDCDARAAVREVLGITRR
jgi:hypothetical protein